MSEIFPNQWLCVRSSTLAGVAIAAMLLNAPGMVVAAPASDETILNACENLLKQGKSHPKCTKAEVQPRCARLAGRGQAHRLCAGISTQTNAAGDSETASAASQVSAGSSTVTSTAPPSTSAAGLGPDVAGLRIGMTPNLARDALKSRSMQSFREYSLDLTYQGVDGRPMLVPNGKYQAVMHAYTKGNERHDAILVAYSSIPGRERVVSVDRSVKFGRDEYPDYDNYLRSLVEKFGNPAWQEKNGNDNLLRWFFGSDGVLANKVTSPIQSVGPGCSARYGYTDVDTSDMREVHSWFLVGISKNQIEGNEKYIQQCGAISVTVNLRGVPGATGPNNQPKFLAAMKVKLIGAGLSQEAKLFAVKQASAARQAEESARTGAAKGKKADL